jgi:hypothetical protein
LPDDGTQREQGATDLDDATFGDTEFGEQALVHGSAEHTFAVGEKFAQRLARRDVGHTEKRVGEVDGFEFHKRARIVALRDRHGAQFGDHRDLTVGGQPLALLFAKFALRQAHFDVATQEMLALARETLEKRFRKRTHTGDGGNAQDQARQKDAETG